MVLWGQLICSVYSVMGRKWVCLFSLIGCKRNQSLKIFLQKQNGTVRLKFWLRKRFQTSELNVVLWGASNVATLQWFFFFYIFYKLQVKILNWFDYVELDVNSCNPTCPRAGVAPGALHPPDWKTGVLWEPMWGESVCKYTQNVPGAQWTLAWIQMINNIDYTTIHTSN